MATFKLRPNGFIYLNHWIDRKNVFRISTKMKIDESKWHAEVGRPLNNKLTYNGKNISAEIVRYENALHRALAFMPDVNPSSITQFKSLFESIISPEQESKPVSNKLMPYFKAYIEGAERRNQSNHKHYNTCYKYITDYVNGDNPSFDEIGMKFYRGFTDYLSELNLAINTIANHIKLFKTVMNSAYMEGLHNNLVFKQFKTKTEATDSIYLTEEELEKIYKLKITGHLAVARDYFIIGAYTGLRFEDWDRVGSDIISDGMIKIRATKTDELSSIPVHPYVRAILDKYEGTLPPKPSNQKMNDYIKVVAAGAGINGAVETRITKGGKKEFDTVEKWQLVSTHTARRSLATNLVLKGVSPYIIMRITGHKHLDNFDKYVRLRELEASIELKSIEFFQSKKIS